MRRQLALLAAIIAALVTFYLVPRPLPELSRAEFIAEVHAGHVRSVEIEDEDVIIAVSTTRGAFRTAFDKKADSALPARLRALGIGVHLTQSPFGLI